MIFPPSEAAWKNHPRRNQGLFFSELECLHQAINRPSRLFSTHHPSERGPRLSSIGTLNIQVDMPGPVKVSLNQPRRASPVSLTHGALCPPKKKQQLLDRVLKNAWHAKGKSQRRDSSKSNGLSQRTVELLKQNARESTVMVSNGSLSTPRNLSRPNLL